MKRKSISHATNCVCIVLLIAFMVAWEPLAGQAQGFRNFEFGFGGGWVNFIPDKGVVQEGLSWGMLLNKQLAAHVSLNFDLGFGIQSFKFEGPVNTTNFISFEMVTNYEIIPQKAFSPFISFGVGALNFSNGKNRRQRFWDAETILGLGAAIRTGVNSRLLISPAFHLTSGDEFDQYINGYTDKYFTVKLKLAFEFPQNNSQERFLASQDYSGPESGNSSYSSSMRKDDGAYLNSSTKVRLLRNRLEELQDNLRIYELEIKQLKGQIETKDQLIRSMEIQLANKK